MNTLRISLVSLALLLSGAQASGAPENQFFSLGKALGNILWLQPQPGIEESQFKAILNVGQSLLYHEPSEQQFKEAFQKVRMIAKGLKKRASEIELELINDCDCCGYYDDQSFKIAATCANLIIDADTIGQLCKNIGMQVRLLAHIPIDLDFEVQTFNGTTDTTSVFYEFGKSYVQDVFDALCTYLKTGDYSSVFTLRARWMSFVSLAESRTPFIPKEVKFAEVFNILAGIRDGMHEYDLTHNLDGLSPSKVILVQLITTLLTEGVQQAESILKGNRKIEFDKFADAFIACGNGLDALG